MAHAQFRLNVTISCNYCLCYTRLPQSQPTVLNATTWTLQDSDRTIKMLLIFQPAKLRVLQNIKEGSGLLLSINFQYINPLTAN